MAAVADGVVVGSALVAVVEESLAGPAGGAEGDSGIPPDLPLRLERAATRLFAR